MNLGYAYMGLAVILVILGTFMAIDGIDPYGDLLLVVSILFIYLGSKELADQRAEREAAKADADTDSTE